MLLYWIEWDWMGLQGIAGDFSRDNVTGAGMKKEPHPRFLSCREYSRNGAVFANTPAGARVIRRIKTHGFS